jgi:peptidoglycan/LPS O-acetylase OafA/YrhL
MLQTWLRIPDIEEAYWTLGVELKFYFIAFLALSLHQLKRPELLVVGWLTSVVIFRCIDSVIGLPHALGTPLIVPSAHLFAAGIMFFLIHSEGHTILRHGIILTAIPLQFWAGGKESMIVVGLFIGTFYMFVLGQLRWIVNEPLRMLGRISYPLYLVHGSIGIATIHWLAARNIPLWMLIAAPVSISLAVATLIHVRLEQPSARILRNWWTANQASRISPTVIDQPVLTRARNR